MSRDNFAPAPQSEDVLVVDTRPGREGQRLYIPAAELPTAIERFGVRLATTEEASESERQRILGGDAGEAATAALAAADELSLGAVSRGAQEAGPEAAQARAALAEINPLAQTLGTVGGGLALGAATTGLGTALGAGRAATTGARIARGLAEGVVAGAAGGAATLEQQLAADPNARLTSERILGTVGVGALLGGSLGGAADALLAGGGALGRRLLRGRSSAAATRDAVEATAERVLGREPAPGVGDRLMRMLGLDEEQRAFAGRALRVDDEGRALRQAIDEGAGAVDEVTRSARRQLDDLDQITRTTEDFSKGELKRSQMRRIVRDDAIDLIADEGVGAFGAIRGLAQQIESDTAIAGGRGFARRMNGAINEYEQQFARAIEQGGRDGATDALIALDRMKRRIGTYVESVSRSPDLRIVQQEMEGAYEQVRALLEREELFGGAALAQREINAAWSPLIARRRVFDRAFRTEVGEQIGFRPLRGADSAKLNSWLQQTGTARASSQDDLFEAFVEEQDRFLQAVAKHYDLPAETSGAIANAQRVTGELRDTLNRVRTSVAARNQMRDLSEALGKTDPLTSGLLGGALGAAGGAPGVAVGGIVGLAARPDRVIRMMASLERMGAAFSARETSAVGRLVTSLRQPGPVSASTARRALQNSAITISASKVSERFDRGVETLERMRDPMALAEQVSQATARIGDRVPEAGAHLAATTARAVGHLQQHLPPGAIQAPMLGAPAPRPSQVVSTEEMRSWLLRAEAIDDPIRVLDAASAGVLVAEHVEALRDVYPALYQSFTETIVDEVSRSDEPLAYQGRVTLSLLLRLPTDASLMPEAIAAAQATHAPQPEPEGPVVTPGNARPPNFSASVATEAQRLEGAA